MENRIYLRAFELEDYKTTIVWRRDSQILNMLGGTKYYVSEEKEKKWIEDSIFDTKDIRLAVCLTESNLHIGNVYLTHIDMQNRNAESHILIGNKSYWGRGYAGEALKLLLDYAFNERGLHRIFSLVLDTNIQSLKMHKKLGYQQESIMRESVFKNGEYQNQIILSILSDYKRSK